LSYQYQTWYTFNSLYGSRSACIDPEVKVKGQCHTATKTVTVAWLLVKRAAAAVAGAGLHVVRLVTFLAYRDVASSMFVVGSRP